MIISVINHTNGLLTQREVLEAIRAVNRQIKEDFEPYWSLGATLRLEGRSAEQPNKGHPIDMRGDAVLYLWDKVDVQGALGYHAANFMGIPFGFVFPTLSKQIGEDWTVTLSHEALEMIADPETNLLVAGPHPENPAAEVFHWYEMSDAVQAETYKIDGINVSNFVLPLYFTSGEELHGHNDFLGTLVGGNTIKSFGVNPGGYIGFYNPQSGKHETFSRKDDEKAKMRLKLKAQAGELRRSVRYQILGTRKRAAD